MNSYRYLIGNGTSLSIYIKEVKIERRGLEYRRPERRGPNAAATETMPLWTPQLPIGCKLEYRLYTEYRRYRIYFYTENWPKKDKNRPKNYVDGAKFHQKFYAKFFFKYKQSVLVLSSPKN